MEGDLPDNFVSGVVVHASDAAGTVGVRQFFRRSNGGGTGAFGDCNELLLLMSLLLLLLRVRGVVLLLGPIGVTLVLCLSCGRGGEEDTELAPDFLMKGHCGVAGGHCRLQRGLRGGGHRRRCQGGRRIEECCCFRRGMRIQLAPSPFALRSRRCLRFKGSAPVGEEL